MDFLYATGQKYIENNIIESNSLSNIFITTYDCAYKPIEINLLNDFDSTPLPPPDLDNNLDNNIDENDNITFDDLPLLDDDFNNYFIGTSIKRKYADI